MNARPLFRVAGAGFVALTLSLMLLSKPFSAVRAQGDATPTPISAAPTTVCPDAPPLRLEFDRPAQVSATTDLPGLPLRAQPKPDAAILRYLPVGAVVQVIPAAPQCDGAGSQMRQVRIGENLGWLAETFGQAYTLEAAAEDAPLPGADLTAKPLICATIAEGEAPAPGTPLLRVAYVTAEGEIAVSDAGGEGRSIVKFSLPPTSLSLSPDGAAIVATNPNGIYWIEVASGKVVMITDSSPFEPVGKSWTNRVAWAPAGNALAVEMLDQSNPLVTYPLWSYPLDATGALYRADTGVQPPNSLRLSPSGGRLLVISAKDISPFPANVDDEASPLLSYVPVNDQDDANSIYVPAITWAIDGTGFYTYIPAGPLTPPDDPVAKHLYYVPLEGDAKDLGVMPNVGPGEYVIPSPDGKYLLLGVGTAWRLQDAATGKAIQAIPSMQYIFDWTPDAKGIVFTYSTGITGYIGLDGSTTSLLVPAQVEGLYGIRWLPDGSILYLTRDNSTGVVALNLKPVGKPTVALGALVNAETFSAAVLPNATPKAVAPVACK